MMNPKKRKNLQKRKKDKKLRDVPWSFAFMVQPFFIYSLP